MTIKERIDWAQEWRAIFEARQAQQLKRSRPEGDVWGDRSDRFARRIDAPDPVRDRVMEWIRPEDTLLDVGAGAGRYAVPFAAKAREVIAVEPSPGMGQRLNEEAQKRGRNNVRLIASDWLAADVPNADIVFCSNVLYFTPEIEAFVQKIDQHARRIAAIVLRVDQGQSGLAGIYQEIWGEPMAPEPSFIELYNVLHQMGIVADVAICASYAGPGRYDSIEQAEAEASRWLFPSDDTAKARIRSFLEAELRSTPEGNLAFPNTRNRTALVSWSKH